MVRGYLLTGLFVMFLGITGIVNAADTKVTTENNDGSSGFSVEDKNNEERFRVNDAGGVVISKLTTVERDALTAIAGMVIFNTDTGLFEGYDGTSWAGVGGTPAPSFTCGVDEVRDRTNSYKTVQIGNQCWMAENLNVGTRIDGTSSQTDNGIIEKYCYNNDPVICATDGGLYQWDEIMQYSTTEGVQGICPTGWHLPTDAEWTTLKNALIQSNPDSKGDQLKTASNCSGGVNCGTSGLQALLAGFRSTGGSFDGRGTGAFFWSSAESGSDAWVRILGASEARVYRGVIVKAFGFSVRCVKD